DDRALQVGRLGDLALLAGLCLALGCCLLGLLAGHQATRIAWRAEPTSCCSSPEIQPATKGIVAATSSSPTTTFAGKPTAKTLSWGTTRETTPKAASVRISASITGPATSRAEAMIPANVASIAPTRRPRSGAWLRPTRS